VERSEFKCGDIIRWKAFDQEFEYHYALVIRLHDYSEYTHYEFPLEYGPEMMTGIEYLPHRYQCVRSITVFSFYEQKTRIIYQSPYDVPYFPELVVYDFDDSPDNLELVGHNED
jgi:hypothetical protein